MAQRKENKKAEAAMDIANRFKEIVSLSTLITTKLREIDAIINQPAQDSSSVITATVRTDILFFTSDIVQLQSAWHNKAFDLGYFETVDGPKKMSKTEIKRYAVGEDV